MTINIDWAAIGFRGNPFSISPPTDPEAAKWADAKTLKGDLQQVLQEARGSAPTQVILCRGPVGGGKTHAALYFSLEDRWPLQDPSVAEICTLRIPTPKETGKPDRDFFLDVMDHLGLDTVKEAIRVAVEEVGLEEAAASLHKIMVSQDFVSALLRLPEEEEGSLLNAYFLGKLTTSELRKVKLNRNIEKTQDYFRILAGVFSCLIGLSSEIDLSMHRRLCLWLDEMEDFVYFAPSQYRPFGQGLRELIDRIPSFFTLFLNFTLTSPEQYEEIELILGTYLIDRITKTIYFRELSDEEQLEYVLEMLAQYRADTTNQDPHYPFERGAVDLLLSDLPRKTPRAINIRIRNSIMKAFMEGVFDEGGQGVINASFIRSLNLENLDEEAA